MAPAAAWCGQCYTSLVKEPVKPPRPPLAAGTALQVLADGHGSVAVLPPPPPAPPGSIPPPPAPPGTTPAALRVGKPDWPCVRCQTVNVYADNQCKACGHGFLDALAEPSARLPLVGDLREINRATKVKLGVAVSIGLCLLILVLFTLAGLVLK